MQAMDQLVAGSRINTDVRPILEFSAPRSLYKETARSNHDMLLQHKTRDFPEMDNFDEQRVTGRASFWYHLGAVYDSRGLPDSARRNYEKAISVDASFAPAYVGLGLNLYGRNNALGAIENLKKAIALDPSGAEAYYNLAQIYHNQGLRNEAIANYRSAIKLSPRPWKYHHKLGDLLMENGRYSDAIEEYKAALKDRTARDQILRSMAGAYEAIGNSKRAAEIRKTLGSRDF